MTPDTPRDEIETVDYQARAAASARPCGRRSCVSEFPGMPSRWCSGCLIDALLQRLADKDRELALELCPFSSDDVDECGCYSHEQLRKRRTR